MKGPGFGGTRSGSACCDSLRTGSDEAATELDSRWASGAPGPLGLGPLGLAPLGLATPVLLEGSAPLGLAGAMTEPGATELLAVVVLLASVAGAPSLGVVGAEDSGGSVSGDWG